MRRGPGGEPDPSSAGAGAGEALAALLEDSAEELYESAPCGYLSTLMDGTIARINATLLGWLGMERRAVVGRKRFADLLTVGGKLYHETHFAPLLSMRGQISGVALELRAADGSRLPVLVSSVVKHGGAGEPLLIRTTVFDATDRRSYEEELLRRRKEADQARAEAEQARRQAEADRARLAEALSVLQRALLPEILPRVPGVDTASYYRTAFPGRLGGDFYDVFPLGDDRWAFFLGDVQGKGPEAATLTSQARYALRAAALCSDAPEEALTTLNAVLAERDGHDDPRYCTVVFGTLEPGGDTGGTRVRIASGGHPPALVLRGSGWLDLLSTPGGMPVGMLPEAHFATAVTELAPGDTLVLYTDGLTEARTGPDRSTLYGEEALYSFAADLAPATAQGAVAALTELLESFGEGLDDDTALLALGAPAPQPEPGARTDRTGGLH